MSTSGIEQMPSYTQTNRLVNTNVYLFKHNPNIIDRPEAPKRDKWETIGFLRLKCWRGWRVPRHE